MSEPVWMGFIVALPCIWIRGYSRRVMWCAALGLSLYLLMLVVGAHHGLKWETAAALRFAFGGACTAHIKSVWEWIRGPVREA